MIKLKNDTKFILKRASEESEEAPVVSINGVDFKNRIIDFRSDISEVSAGFLIKAIQLLEKESTKPIHINFSSAGGDVIEGLAIYDCIKASKCEIHIRACGKIMSMGFIVYLAADYRTATPNTSFMMHSIYYAPSPDAKAVKNHETEALEAKRLNNVLLDIMAERTKKPKSYWYRTIQSLVDKYLTYDEALQLGVIKLSGTKTVKRRKKNVKTKV